MEHFFELPVLHEGKELLLKGRLVTFAYSYKFYIILNGRELTFERDDEGKFRVLDEVSSGLSGTSGELIERIIGSLENL